MTLRAKHVWIGMILVCAVASSAAAGGLGRSSQMPFAGRGLMGFKTFIELDLSETQKADALKIIDGFMAFRDSKTEAMQEARANMKAVMQSETFNEEQAREAFRQTTAIREELFVKRAKMMSELKALLTPEQLELLKQKQADRQAKFKERMLNRLLESSQ